MLIITKFKINSLDINHLANQKIKIQNFKEAGKRVYAQNSAANGKRNTKTNKPHLHICNLTSFA